MRFFQFIFFLASVLMCIVQTSAQNIVPVKDFNNYFVNFQDGFFRPIEIQPILSYKAGDEVVAYIDTRGNMRIYDGIERKDVTALNVDYQVSDHLIGFMIANGLRMWDAGKFTSLTNYGRGFVVKDSILVFEDTRYQSLNVYWNKQVLPLVTMTNGLSMPTAVGENIAVYKDNSDTYFCFWQGKTFEIATYNQEAVDFQVGTDVFCFKDPYTQSFMMFDKGEFYEIESSPIKSYKAGRGFIVYEDLNGNLWMFKDGEKISLSNFSTSFWDVKDDMTVWRENSYLFAYTNDEKMEVATYFPTEYLLKNNTFVFRNILGGVSAVVNGKIHEISNMRDSEFEIYGNKVLVKLFNHTSLVFSDGKIYTN